MYLLLLDLSISILPFLSEYLYSYYVLLLLFYFFSSIEIICVPFCLFAILGSFFFSIGIYITYKFCIINNHLCIFSLIKSYISHISNGSANVELEFRSPRARSLWDKWRYVWMLAWERQRRLHDHLVHLQDLERVRQFSWDEWRKRVCIEHAPIR